MAIYDGRELVEYYDVPLDDDIEKHVRWFVGAVDDEGANRVRVTQRDEDGLVKKEWKSNVDSFFNQFMDSLSEELAEERLVTEMEGGSEY